MGKKVANEKSGCSQLVVDETRYGEDFQRLVDSLFCACLCVQDAPEKTLGRDLFRMVDLEGLELSKAAEALGISAAEAKGLQEKTRREIAILLVLGLGAFSNAEVDDANSVPGCRCGCQSKETN